MHQTLAKIWHFIEQERMLDTCPSVVLAVSGGADSTAMLHIFHALTAKLWPKGSICVAHLNHKLRGRESDDDEIFVRDLCAKLKIECFTESADVRELAESSKENLEAAARRLRYQFFDRVAVEYGAAKIATAHTVNDQAETFLLRLIRGSGGAGLGGISPVRPLISMQGSDIPILLIRPLLCLTRDEVISYCEDNHLEYRTDSSNLSLDYSRNRVRHEIIPQLALLNPQIITVLSESANRLRADENFLHQEVIDRLATALNSNTDSVTVPVDVLNGSPVVLRVRMIREIISGVRGDLRRITSRHLSSIESLLKPGKSGKIVTVPGVRITREFNAIVFRRTSAESVSALKPVSDYVHTLAESGEVRIRLNNRELIISLIRTEKYVWGERSRFTALLDGSGIELPLTVRTRRKGDRYLTQGAKNSNRVKELMIENRVPLNERIIYPVITTSGDEIVWIPGLPVAAKFAASPDTTDWIVLRAVFVDEYRSA